MASPENTVAFIGLGVMGHPMGRNLRKGLSRDQVLLICDVNKDAIARFQEETADQGPVEVVASGFEAVQAANVVITMLPDSKAVKDVYQDETTGLLAGIAAIARESSGSPSRNILLMECGTIETDTILGVAEAVKVTNGTLSSANLQETITATFVDAPVSGGPMGAQDATLTFMVGAYATDDFERARDYLKHMGKPDSVFHCGEVGAGTAFKVINNYLSAITSLAASEALNIGVKMGLNPKLLSDVINVSGGQCWVTSKSNPVPGVMENVPSSRDYEGGFRLNLCAKVLGMGSRLAEMVGARTVLDRPTLEAFREAIEGGYGAKDARVVYKWLNESERKR